MTKIDRSQVLAALRPFATFIDTPAAARMPGNMPLTNGSQMARVQVTADDLRRAKALYDIVASNP